MNNNNFEMRMRRDIATRMTCEEANCEANRIGWFTVLDVATDEHAALATWVKQHSRRRFWEWLSAQALDEALRLQARGELTVTPDLRAMLEHLPPGLVVFCFPPGQQCFTAHLDREVEFRHRRGFWQWRGGQNVFQPTRPAYTHVNPLDFNEDMNETAERLEVLRKRG